MTGEGRVPAGDFRAIVDVGRGRGAVRADRSRGGRARSTGPAATRRMPTARYFHQFLADTLRRRAPDAAGRRDRGPAAVLRRAAPSSTCSAARSAISGTTSARRASSAGVPRSDTDARATPAHPPRLHRHGAARSRPAARSTTRSSNADGFPALMALPPGGAPRRVAWRVARQPDLGSRRLGRVRPARARAIGRALFAISTRSRTRRRIAVAG